MRNRVFVKDPFEGERTIVYWTGTQQPLCASRLWYGDLVRLPPEETGSWVSLVLGGAFTQPAMDSSSSYLINPVGLIHDIFHAYEEGAPFIEQVTGQLVGEQRVFIGYPFGETAELFVWRDGTPGHIIPNDWCEMMAASGFSIDASLRSNPYVSAVGTGTDLCQTQWLKGMGGYDRMVMSASRAGRTPLEKLISRWMQSGADATKEMEQLARRMKSDPSLIWKLTSGADIFYSSGGFEGYEVVINVRGDHLPRISEVLRDAAVGLGLRLFYGGEAPQASGISQSGYVFDTYYKWTPVPSEWERVV